MTLHPNALTLWPGTVLDYGRVIETGDEVWCLPAARIESQEFARAYRIPRFLARRDGKPRLNRPIEAMG